MGFFNTMALMCVWVSIIISTVIGFFNMMKKMKRKRTGSTKKSDDHVGAAGAGRPIQEELTEMQQLKVLVKENIQLKTL